MGCRSDSIAISRDMGPLSVNYGSLVCFNARENSAKEGKIKANKLALNTHVWRLRQIGSNKTGDKKRFHEFTFNISRVSDKRDSHYRTAKLLLLYSKNLLLAGSMLIPLLFD